MERPLSDNEKGRLGKDLKDFECQAEIFPRLCELLEVRDPVLFNFVSNLE